jgi:hypothetical protein
VFLGSSVSPQQQHPRLAVHIQLSNKLIMCTAMSCFAL